MKWLLFAVVGLAVIVAVVAAVGAMLPRNHIVSRTLATSRTPEEIWTVVANPAFAAEATGQDVPVDIVESSAPARLVTRISDASLPFGGTWTYVIAPVPGGSTLTIVENGFVSNVFFRFVSKYLMGHHRTMDAYLTHVAARFKEKAELTGS